VTPDEFTAASRRLVEACAEAMTDECTAIVVVMHRDGHVARASLPALPAAMVDELLLALVDACGERGPDARELLVPVPRRDRRH